MMVMRLAIIRSLMFGLACQILGCGDAAEEAPAALADSPEVMGAIQKRALQADMQLIDSTTETAEAEDAGVVAGDVVCPTTIDGYSIEGLRALIKEVKETQDRVALRQRELLLREEQVVLLEGRALEKSANLKQERAEIEALMAALAEKFSTVGQAYDAMQKKKKEDFERRQAERASEREAQLVALVATLKGMRPSSGGEMLSSMEDGNAVDVLRRLEPKLAASLLSGMEARRAAKLSEMAMGPKPEELQGDAAQGAMGDSDTTTTKEEPDAGNPPNRTP